MNTAEMTDTENVPSSTSQTMLVDENESDSEDRGAKDELEGEPAAKKHKGVDQRIHDLEARLLTVLCCSVCLDLPNEAVYQVRSKKSCQYILSPPTLLCIEKSCL